MILVVFFHASVYNFANINKIDFSNPPIVVVLISFLILWGGMLIIYSGMINTIMASIRTFNNGGLRHLKFIFIAGAIYILLHYVLNIFLGRWSNDFVNNKPDMTVVASSIRNMRLTFPHITKLFDGSTLSTIGFNLMFVGLALYFLLRKNGIAKEKRNYLILGISGTLIMLLSFTRIYIYPALEQSINQKNYFLATIYSYTIANPYPLLPYLAYGLFGAMIGLMICTKRKDLLKKCMAPIGLFFFIYGLIGCLNFEKTISTPDYFWYFKTHLELGIFILSILLMLFAFEYRNKELRGMKLVKLFSRVTLTVYFLETLVSEVFGKILSITLPGWNQTITACLIFGLFNVLFWIMVLWLWEKARFKYSLEYFWIKLFEKLGKKSTKLQDYGF